LDKEEELLENRTETGRKKQEWLWSVNAYCRTCPARLGPSLIDDLDVASFAVVVGGEADGTADGSDVIGSGSVHERHAVGADE
jgi:hypothetical protein